MLLLPELQSHERVIAQQKKPKKKSSVHNNSSTIRLRKKMGLQAVPQPGTQDRRMHSPVVFFSLERGTTSRPCSGDLRGLAEVYGINSSLICSETRLFKTLQMKRRINANNS